MCSGEGDFLTRLPVVCFSKRLVQVLEIYLLVLSADSAKGKINTSSLTLLIQILDSEEGTRRFSGYPVLPCTCGWPDAPW